MTKDFKYIYLHHPGCSKAQKCLSFLNDKIPQQFQLIDYTKEPLSPEKLKDLLEMMDQSDLDIVLREGNVKSRDGILQVLVKDPLQMQRPILINNHLKKAVIGRPLERIETILQ